MAFPGPTSHGEGTTTRKGAPDLQPRQFRKLKMSEDGTAKKKKSRKEREKELRDEGLGCGFRKDVIADRHRDDQRYERELEYKQKVAQGEAPPEAHVGGKAPSAAFDAIIRMETGKPERTIAQKISDPNRPTWEDYKKAKADKLDLGGVEMKKMMEYRAQLDREREARLAGLKGDKGAKKKRSKKGDDDSESDESVKDKKSRKKKDKKKDKKRKKDKKKKKEKKRKRESEDSGAENGEESGTESEDDSEESGSDTSERKRKKRKKGKGTDEDDGPVRLSSFFQKGGDGSGSESS